MKTTVSLIALLIVLAFMLALGIIAYREAMDLIKHSEDMVDYMHRAIASCMLILLFIYLILVCLSISIAVYSILYSSPGGDA